MGFSMRHRSDLSDLKYWIHTWIKLNQLIQLWIHGGFISGHCLRASKLWFCSMEYGFDFVWRYLSILLEAPSDCGTCHPIFLPFAAVLVPPASTSPGLLERTNVAMTKPLSYKCCRLCVPAKVHGAQACTTHGAQACTTEYTGKHISPPLAYSLLQGRLRNWSCWDWQAGTWNCHCQYSCVELELASLRLVSSHSHLAYWQEPMAPGQGQCFVTCVAPVILPVQNHRIDFWTTNCSPLIHNIPHIRLLQGLAAEFL
jgi:hypothetical protein